jgi:polar amino acid transport system substrate-binding protein
MRQFEDLRRSFMYQKTLARVASVETRGGRPECRAAAFGRRRGAVVALMLGLTLCLTACGILGGGAGPAPENPSPANPGVSLDSVQVNDAARALLPADIRSSGVLNAGMNAPAPPFWLIDTNGSTEYSGVEFDLIQAIGKSLGLEIKLTNLAWDGLMPALAAERFNVIISNIGDRAERRKNINFVDYGKTSTGLLVLADNANKYKESSDMCGTTIGYQTGAGAGPLLQGISDKTCPKTQPITLKALSDLKALFPALLSGQIDSLGMDSSQIYYWSNLEQEGTPKYAAVLDNLREFVPYGIGVNNKYPDLARAIQAALQGLQKSGMYQKIFDAGGIGKLTVENITINGEPTI